MTEGVAEQLSVVLTFVSSLAHRLDWSGFSSEYAAEARTFAAFLHVESFQDAALSAFLVFYVVEYFVVDLRFGPRLRLKVPEARVFAVIHLLLFLCLVDSLLYSRDLIVDFHDLFEIICRLVFLFVENFEAQIS